LPERAFSEVGERASGRNRWCGHAGVWTCGQDHRF